MDHHQEHLHETPAVVTVPLILLAIPSVVIGALTIGPMLFGDVFKGVIFVLPEHNVLEHLAEHHHGALGFALHGLTGLPFILVLAGFGSAWYLYMMRPDLPDLVQQYAAVMMSWIASICSTRSTSRSSCVAARTRTVPWKYADAGLIDGLMVNGTARLVGCSRP